MEYLRGRDKRKEAFWVPTSSGSMLRNLRRRSRLIPLRAYIFHINTKLAEIVNLLACSAANLSMLDMFA